MKTNPPELHAVRQVVIASFLCAAGIVVPMIFHAVGLGRMFLPMHLPILIAGLVLPWREAVITGLVTPWASALITGMPPMPTAVIMSIELAALAGIASLLVAARLPLWAASLLAIAARACVTWLATSLLAKWFGLPHQVAGWAAVAAGAPGMLIQLVFAPAFAGFIGRKSLAHAPSERT